MGKNKIIRVDAQGNLVEVGSKADTIIVDVKKGKFKKVNFKKKPHAKQAGMRRFNRGGKV